MKWCPLAKPLAALSLTLLIFVGCGESSSPAAGAGGAGAVGGAPSATGGAPSTAGASALASTGGSASAGGSASTGGSPSAGGSVSTGGTDATSTITGGANSTGGTATAATTSTESVTVKLAESSYEFATPDLKHTLSATVTGSSNTSVTWTSSNTYIATVDATGIVTSVSGGQATITATSVADPSKSAVASVSIVEPNRARAATYVDAKSITSGPVGIITCGDSLTRTYAANAADQTGWGQVLAQFLSTDVAVDNTISNGGRSSRSFYNEVGRWDTVKMRLQAAQGMGKPMFVFIMFGHNDQKKVTDTDGPSYLTFASQNPNGTIAGTYYDYLERYIVEARALGGIPVLFTPFVREYLEGSPATVTSTGQHNITVPYAGEAAARGDYPAAAKAVAAKHDVPLIDITSWSKSMVEARAAAGTLPYVYISSDQTHIRNLGALLVAQEAVLALNAQGILTNYSRTVAPKLMLDAGTLAFGGLFAGSTLDKTFRLSPFGDVSGSLTLSAPSGYTISLDGNSFVAQAKLDLDASYAGNVVTVRFAPTDVVAYNAELGVTHGTITPDYGNTVPNPTPGVISLTGNGKAAIAGAPATVTWPMFAGTTIDLSATTSGGVSAGPATLTGLANKNVANAAARFDTLDSTWPAESARNAARFVQFQIPASSVNFTLDSISVDAGTGGGSNIRWDIVYSLTADFASPTALGSALSGTKDTLVTSSYPSLGVSVPAGQSLYLRVYPYSTTAATSGKSFMLANVVISGVTN